MGKLLLFICKGPSINDVSSKGEGEVVKNVGIYLANIYVIHNGRNDSYRVSHSITSKSKWLFGLE